MHARQPNIPEQNRAGAKQERTRPYSGIPTPAPAGNSAPAVAEQTKLVIRRGPGAGSEFDITKERTTLGRHRDCDIVLDDVTISRHHAELLRDDDRYVVADIGSLNGVYVNRQLIERGELADGDELWVGKFHFTFHTGAAR